LILSYESNTDGSTSVMLTAVQWPFRLTYVGNDGNWFNPNNWIDSNTGMPANRTPSANDNVTIDGKNDVFLDPSMALNQIEIHNLIIKNDRTLNIMNGTKFIFNNASIENGLLEFHSSEVTGRHLISAAGVINTPYQRPGGWGCTWCGSTLGNPSIINIETQIYNGILAVGLGGVLQAEYNHTGPGYYASFNGNYVELTGDLVLQLLYGFTPSAGDTFQIITANTLSGQFNRLEEGDLVTSFENVSLYISYQGGDGNDVVLTAVESDDFIFGNGFE